MVCWPLSTALLVESPPQKQVSQHLDSDSVRPHVGIKTVVFLAAVFEVLCRRNVKQLEQNLRGSLPQALSRQLLHSKKEIQK